MLEYIVRRILWMIPTLILISILSFAMIQLPPGDFLTSRIISMELEGNPPDPAWIEAMRVRYGLNEPVYIQYFKWIRNIILEGDFGRSFAFEKPVSELIWERLALTVLMSALTILFNWFIAIPIGIYSATHQYSIADYAFTFIGFIGRAVPNFLLAIILMWLGYTLFGLDMGGLFSREYQQAPWSWEKFLDMLGHLWLPVLVLGTSSTAGLIRTLRANLLDELHKPYVVAARAKGLPWWYIVLKYPVRIALNPFFSNIGNILPALISGASIVSVVLSLPTTGPIMLRALMTQDMYLAGSFLLMLSTLTLIGTLISDIVLAIMDPRIRQTAS
jgi:peptide/nickel transport system permease protein